MKKSLKVLFFGNESLATGLESRPVIFEALLNAEYNVAGLVVHSRGARSRSAKKEAIINMAESRGIPVINPENLKDCADEIASYGADIGVLVAYGKIVPKNIIDLFQYGIINVHPSLLPLYRGSTPIETALLDGVSETGVSIMSLVPEMDAGPVYTQEKVRIDSTESKQELAIKLHDIGAKLILKTLDKIAHVSADTTDQNSSEATYTKQISKSDGHLDFYKPAEVLAREVKAYAGWPGSYFEHNNHTYIVTSAKATNESTGLETGSIFADAHSMAIQTTNGTLYIEAIKPKGKKEMPIQAFLNGYRSQFN